MRNVRASVIGLVTLLVLVAVGGAVLVSRQMSESDKRNVAAQREGDAVRAQLKALEDERVARQRHDAEAKKQAASAAARKQAQAVAEARREAAQARKDAAAAKREARSRRLAPQNPAPAPAPAYGGIFGLPSGLLCRDLAARGYSYDSAMQYWSYWNGPSAMDADRDGIPCETVYPLSDVRAYWGDDSRIG